MQVDLIKCAVEVKAVVVKEVAEVVEGLVGIFDGDLGDGGGVQELADDGFVKMSPMRVFLMGGENEELRYAGARWERGWG